eukprot:13525540-Ditylum_brightwellii.AAC.1
MAQLYTMNSNTNIAAIIKTSSTEKTFAEPLCHYVMQQKANRLAMVATLKFPILSKTMLPCMKKLLLPWASSIPGKKCMTPMISWIVLSHTINCIYTRHGKHPLQMAL